MIPIKPPDDSYHVKESHEFADKLAIRKVIGKKRL